MTIYKTMKCALRYRNHGYSIHEITQAMVERGLLSETTGNPLTVSQVARLLHLAETRYSVALRSTDRTSTPEQPTLVSESRGAVGVSPLRYVGPAASLS